MERRSLRQERDRARAARLAPFWKSDAIANLLLTPSTLVTMRHRNTTPDDRETLRAFVEEKLVESLAYPRREAVQYIARAEHFAAAPAERRARLAGLLAGQALPQTSMHGDFHFMNLVRSGTGVGVIDWEFFEPEGTFLFDYLDFHFHLEVDGAGIEDFLMALEPTHPVVARASAALGIDPRAVIVSYGLHDLSKKIGRLGGPAAIPPQMRQAMEQVIRRLERL